MGPRGGGVDYLIQAVRWSKIEEQQQGRRLRNQATRQNRQNTVNNGSDRRCTNMTTAKCEEGKRTELVVADWVGSTSLVRNKEFVKDTTRDSVTMAMENESTASSSIDSETSKLSDQELVDQAQVLFHEQQILEAVRLLRQVKKKGEYLTAFHRQLLKNAILVEEAVNDLLTDPAEGGWTKQGESHGTFDSAIYYKVPGKGAKLTCRMETPIPTSLVVPLLSVLNESSLFDTWIPSWKRPVRLGIRKSSTLINDTRGHQIIRISSDVPWPLSTRELIIDAFAVDDIEEQGIIAIKLRSDIENPSDWPEGFILPPVEKGSHRIDFDGSILFRVCPTDYPNYESSREKIRRAAEDNGDEDADELVLVQFTMNFDAHMDMVPSSVINFVTRTVIGRVWAMFLSVSEDVRVGTQGKHQRAIAAKPEFYRWVQERCDVMFDRLKDKQQLKQAAENVSTGRTVPSDSTQSSTAGTATPNQDWTMEEALKIAC